MSSFRAKGLKFDTEVLLSDCDLRNIRLYQPYFMYRRKRVSVCSSTIYCPLWVRFAVRDLHVTPWGVWEFHANRCGGGHSIVQGVPLPTKPGSSLIIPKPMKILQRDLNRSTLVVWEMKRNVSVVKLCLYVSECVCSNIIKELPGLVGSGTRYIRASRSAKEYNNQLSTSAQQFYYC